VEEHLKEALDQKREPIYFTWRSRSACRELAQDRLDGWAFPSLAPFLGFRHFCSRPSLNQYRQRNPNLNLYLCMEQLIHRVFLNVGSGAAVSYLQVLVIIGVSGEDWAPNLDLSAFILHYLILYCLRSHPKAYSPLVDHSAPILSGCPSPRTRLAAAAAGKNSCFPSWELKPINWTIISNTHPNLPLNWCWGWYCMSLQGCWC